MAKGKKKKNEDVSPSPPSSPTTIAGCPHLATIVAMSVLLLQLGILWMIPSKEMDDAAEAAAAAAAAASKTAISYPVIVLGLPRSGSFAIHQYFQCHGAPSRHYCCGGRGRGRGRGSGSTQTKFPCLDDQAPTCGDCVLKNLQNDRPAFSNNCGSATSTSTTDSAHHPQEKEVWSSFDVETADAWFLPQHFALGLLHRAYPNATWILNTRTSPHQWAESIYHWQSLSRRLLTTFGMADPLPTTTPGPQDKPSPEHIEADMQHQLTSRVYNQTYHSYHLAVLERIYQNHTTTIRQWARQFPSHPYLELNVDDDASLAILDEAFGWDSLGMGGGDGKCQWEFDPPDQDWKDFQYPF